MKKFLTKKKLVLFLLIVIFGAASIFAFTYFNSSQKLSDICPDLLNEGKGGRVKYISTEIKTPDSFDSTQINSYEIKKALSGLEISLHPINDDKSLSRDKTVSVAFEELTDDFPTGAYSEIVYFNLDFSEVWIYNEGIPTYTYKVRNPEEAKEICNVRYKME